MCHLRKFDSDLEYNLHFWSFGLVFAVEELWEPPPFDGMYTVVVEPCGIAWNDDVMGLFCDVVIVNDVLLTASSHATLTSRLVIIVLGRNNVKQIIMDVYNTQHNMSQQNVSIIQDTRCL